MNYVGLFLAIANNGIAGFYIGKMIWMHKKRYYKHRRIEKQKVLRRIIFHGLVSILCYTTFILAIRGGS